MFSVVMCGIIYLIICYITSNIFLDQKVLFIIRDMIIAYLVIIYIMYTNLIVPLMFAQFPISLQLQIMKLGIPLGIYFVIMGLNAGIIQKNDYEIKRFMIIVAIIIVPIMNLVILNSDFQNSLDTITLDNFILYNNFLLLLTVCFATIMTYFTVSKTIKSCESKTETIKYRFYILVKNAIVIICIFSMAYTIFSIIDYTQFIGSGNIDDETMKYNLIYAGGNVVEYKEPFFIIKSIINSFYFSLVTFTTVGFGDIYPNTIYSRIVVILEIISMANIVFIGFNLYANKE